MLNDRRSLRCKLELGFAGLTGVLFVTFGLLANASKVFFAVPCIALWGTYALWRIAQGERRELGLVFDGLGRASIVPGAMILLVIATSLARRIWLGWTPPPSETWLLLFIYPPWALVQQLTAAGLVWTWWFRKHPTLIPIAIAHGLSGAFVYTWILERSALN